MDGFVLYYVGGPWDLHKVAMKERPSSATVIVRELLKLTAKPYDEDGAEIRFQEHEYYVQEASRDGRVMVAIHEDLL